MPVTGLVLLLLARAVGLDADLTAALIYMAAAPTISSAANLCFILGLNARRALEVTIAATLLTPVLGPVTVELLQAGGPSVPALELARNLGLMVAGGILLGVLIRHTVGPAQIDRNGHVFDGLGALALILLVIPLFDGVPALIVSEPRRAALVLIVALVVNFGFDFLLRTGLARAMPATDAATYALVFANRTVALYAAALPHDPRFSLFVALYQVPILFTPLILHVLPLRSRRLTGAGTKPKTRWRLRKKMTRRTVRGRHAAAQQRERTSVKIGAPKETFDGEKRVAMTPQSAAALKKLGYDCLIEAGAGEAARFSDAAYAEAGVEVVPSAAELWAEADIVAKVRAADAGGGRAGARPGQIVVSFVYPAQNPELLESLKAKGVTAHRHGHGAAHQRGRRRWTRCRSMANIAGYRAVIEAGENFGRFFTGQVTAAGKVPPAKVLVIGAGVAGPLGDRHGAPRSGRSSTPSTCGPRSPSRSRSMGAEFVYLDFAEAQQDGAATGGYAAPSSPEFREKQLEKFRALAPDIDIVITTALIPGRPAPKLWLKDMVEAMKPGSVVVDLAAEQGGNCDLTKPGKMFETKNGVRIVGYTDIASRMATQASTLYGNNIRHMMDDLTPGKDGQPVVNMEDDVIRGATVTHEGAVTFPPPPPKIAGDRRAEAEAEGGRGDRRSRRRRASSPRCRKASNRTTALLVVGTVLTLLVGTVAPVSFMQHFIVFALACFVGFYVIWNVATRCTRR